MEAGCRETLLPARLIHSDRLPLHLRPTTGPIFREQVTMGIMSDDSKQFEYLAIGGEVPHHGVLPQRAVEQYLSIQQYLT